QDPDILGGLGLVYLRAGNQKQALNYFKQALALNTNPDTQSKWENLVQTSSYWTYLDDGDKFAARGNFSKAEQRYKSAMTIDQSGPYAFTSLGALYLQQGKYAAADRYYRMALERDKL
ncbi:tetratricopeptide repeat protein, partial [Vibrio natriegens]